MIKAYVQTFLKKMAAPSLVFAALAGQGISYKKVYLFHFVLILNFILFFINWKKIQLLEFIIKFCSLNWEFLAIVTFLFVSLLWSPPLLDGLNYISYWLIGLSLLFVSSFLVSTDTHFFLKVGLCFLLIHGFISILEYFQVMRMPLSEYSTLNATFGRDVHFSARKTLSLQASLTSTTGFFWNPNNSALFILLTLPFQLLLDNRIQKLALIVFSLFIIHTTGSDAIKGLSILFLILVMTIKLSQKYPIFKKVFITSLALIVPLGSIFFFKTHSNVEGDYFSAKITGLIFILPKFIASKFSGEPFDLMLVQNAIRERFFYLSSGIDLIKDSYGLGIGPGKIRTTELFLEDRYMKMESMHFYWLEIMLVSGLVGFGMFFKWYGKVLKALYQRKNPIAQAAFQSSVLLLPGAIVLSSAVYYLPMYLLFGICSGMILAQTDSTRSISKDI